MDPLTGSSSLGQPIVHCLYIYIYIYWKWTLPDHQSFCSDTLLQTLNSAKFGPCSIIFFFSFCPNGKLKGAEIFFKSPMEVPSIFRSFRDFPCLVYSCPRLAKLQEDRTKLKIGIKNYSCLLGQYKINRTHNFGLIVSSCTKKVLKF